MIIRDTHTNAKWPKKSPKKLGRFVARRFIAVSLKNGFIVGSFRLLLMLLLLLLLLLAPEDGRKKTALTKPFHWSLSSHRYLHYLWVAMKEPHFFAPRVVVVVVVVDVVFIVKIARNSFAIKGARFFFALSL